MRWGGMLGYSARLGTLFEIGMTVERITGVAAVLCAGG